MLLQILEQSQSHSFWISASIQRTAKRIFFLFPQGKLVAVAEQFTWLLQSLSLTAVTKTTSTAESVSLQGRTKSSALETNTVDRGAPLAPAVW
jgi:hypothetical protein